MDSHLSVPTGRVDHPGDFLVGLANQRPGGLTGPYLAARQPGEEGRRKGAHGAMALAMLAGAT